MHWKDFDSPGRLNLQIGQVADGYRSVDPVVFHGHNRCCTVRSSKASKRRLIWIGSDHADAIKPNVRSDGTHLCDDCGRWPLRYSVVSCNTLACETYSFPDAARFSRALFQLLPKSNTPIKTAISPSTWLQPLPCS